jgi:hypothetical protein
MEIFGVLTPITLVKYRGKEVSVGIGRFCFSIGDNGELIPSDAMHLETHKNAYRLCQNALKYRAFEKVEENQ